MTADARGRGAGAGPRPDPTPPPWGVTPAQRQRADALREVLARRPVDPAEFAAALGAVAPQARDAWLDRVLGLGPPPDDGPALPRGGVPYLPSPIEALTQIAARTALGPEDRVVDLGAGVGRALAALHLLTGARGGGVEIQPALVAAAQALAGRLAGTPFEIVCGDAATLADRWRDASVVVLYCPFGGARLDATLDRLEPLARAHLRWVATIDLPLPARPWLVLDEPTGGAVELYRVDRAHRR